MIRFVESNLHDRVHDNLGNLDLFGSLHLNDDVTDPLTLHECFEFGREIPFHKRPASISAGIARDGSREDSHYGLQAERPEKVEVFRHWEAAAIKGTR